MRKRKAKPRKRFLWRRVTVVAALVGLFGGVALARYSLAGRFTSDGATQKGRNLTTDANPSSGSQPNPSPTLKPNTGSEPLLSAPGRPSEAGGSHSDSCAQPAHPIAAPAISKVLPPNDTPKGPWAKAPELETKVTAAMAGFSGRFSVAVADLESGAQWIFHPGEQYHTASLVKLPVTLYALDRYRAGALRWDQMITFTEADVDDPRGPFEDADFGAKFSVRDLSDWALRCSNNVAVNMLGRTLDWGLIRGWTSSIGYPLYRRPDSAPEAAPEAVLGWLKHLHRLSVQDPSSAELLLGSLRNATFTDRISAGLPAGVVHAHKYGSYDGNEHDAAIIYASHPYALVVMTEGDDEGEANDATARVSAAVYAVLTH